MEDSTNMIDETSESPEPGPAPSARVFVTARRRGRPAPAPKATRPAKKTKPSPKVMLPRAPKRVVVAEIPAAVVPTHGKEEMVSNLSFTESETSRSSPADDGGSVVTETDASDVEEMDGKEPNANQSGVETENDDEDEGDEEQVSETEEEKDEEDDEQQGQGPENQKIVERIVEQPTSSAMNSQPKSGKGKAATKKTKNASQSGDKKRKRKKRTGPHNYTMYLYKVHRQLHKDLTLSTKTMDILNSFTNDMFERIATEAASLSRLNRKQTLGSNEVQTATRLVLGYSSLGDHAIAEGMKAMLLYERNSDKKKK